jgi:hypothetical protein
MQRRHGIILLIGLVWLATGCDQGPKMYPVRGTITFDGQPVEEGDIIFVPIDPNLNPDSGPIKNGHFAFAAKAGKKRVEIRASRVVPGKQSPMGPIHESYIPPEYNSRSRLEAEVVPGGTNQWDFPLTSRRPRS